MFAEQLIPGENVRYKEIRNSVSTGLKFICDYVFSCEPIGLISVSGCGPDKETSLLDARLKACRKMHLYTINIMHDN